MNSKSIKTVLSFIDWYLPGYRGGGVLKAFANQVSHFCEDYRFKIITRDMDYMDNTPYKSVRSDEWNVIGKNTEVYYTSAKSINYAFLRNLVQNTEFDAVYIHGIYSPWFSILPIILAKKKKATKIVVATHGMLGEHALAIKTTKKKTFIAAAKLFGLYKNVFFHAANQEEADDVIKAIGANANVIIAEEMPMRVPLGEWRDRRKKEGELKIVSIARIAPEKNTLYAVEIFKEAIEGKITYDIYGPVYGDDYWEKCKAVIAQLPDNVTVNYKGSLPGDEVLDTLRNYHFMLLPSTGENFGHVILESFMASTPVIISDKTPWRNLEDRGVGWELPLAKMKGFSDKLTYAAKLGQDEYGELSRNSLAYAIEFMSDETIKVQNERLFNNGP